MKSDYQLNLWPRNSDLKEVENWLIEEYNNFHEGFYCNWSVIENAFQAGKLFTLNYKDLAIGFLVWSVGGIYVEIDIMEIKSDFRNAGIGEIFLNKISEFFKEEGLVVLKLFCAPPESEKFWKKMNFIKFPYRGYDESHLIYYKPLIKDLKTTNLKSENKIELWDIEPYKIKDNKPKWTWEIDPKNDRLLLPIIQPCNCDWNLRWTKNGQVIKEDKVKYFTENNSIYHGPFLFITELNE